MKLRIFDICGTLYDSNTTLDFCQHVATKERKRYLRLLRTSLGKALNKITTRLLNYDLIRIEHLKTLSGLTSESLENLSDDFVKNHLNKKEIVEAHQYISSFNNKEILLVSATIEPVARAIAKELGGLAYMSTSLKFDNNICEGKIQNDLLGNKHKFFVNKNIDFVITDNKSDFALCNIANNVVIITKRKNLKFWNNSSLNITRIILL